jgi:hypothetical protein
MRTLGNAPAPHTPSLITDLLPRSNFLGRWQQQKYDKPLHLLHSDVMCRNNETISDRAIAQRLRAGFLLQSSGFDIYNFTLLVSREENGAGTGLCRISFSFPLQIIITSLYLTHLSPPPEVHDAQIRHFIITSSVINLGAWTLPGCFANGKQPDNLIKNLPLSRLRKFVRVALQMLTSNMTRRCRQELLILSRVGWYARRKWRVLVRMIGFSST